MKTSITPSVLALAATQLVHAGAGCGNPHDGGSLKRDITSSGKTRTYEMYVPDDYDPEHSYPTVIGFHGRNGSGSGFADSTNMNYEQWTGDKLAVYPDGVHNGEERN